MKKFAEGRSTTNKVDVFLSWLPACVLARHATLASFRDAEAFRDVDRDSDGSSGTRTRTAALSSPLFFPACPNAPRRIGLQNLTARWTAS